MTKKIWKHRFAIFYFKIFSTSFNLVWRLICLLLWSGQIFMILLIIDVCCYFQVWLNFSLHQSRTWWCYWWDELICWSLVEMCWSGLVETNYQVTSFSVVTRAELRLTWGCTRALAAMGAAPATARSAGGRELLVAEVYTPVDWWTWDPPSARSSSAASSLISASQHLLLLLIRHRILSTNKHCHSKHNTFLTFLFAQARGGKHIFRHLDGGWKLYPQLLKLKTQKSIMFSISFALYKNFVPSCWC